MRVVVSERIADAVKDRVRDADLPVDVLVVDQEGQTEADLNSADVLLRHELGRAAYQRIVQAAPNLRWIHTGSAGVEQLLSDDITDRGIVFTNSAGVYGVPIAEWVMHALLMIVKHGREMIEAQQAKRWNAAPEFDELAGKTITILGPGGIGMEIAKRAAGFDMRVWGVNRSGNSVPHVERIFSGDSWRQALSQTDFLVIATPLTDATRGLIGQHELDLLPAHAWLVNIARGAIIDESALIESLTTHTIAGAALDTFVEEPLPPDNPLWSLPNVIISPHHSGSSPRSLDRVLDLFTENLRRFLNGEELQNVVDLEAGY